MAPAVVFECDEPDNLASKEFQDLGLSQTGTQLPSLETGSLDCQIDPVTMKRYTRKCDLIVIPMVSFAYLLDSLDRSNLGNAQTAGLSKDLGLRHNQYNLCLTAYYVAMIIFGPIGSVVSRRVSGKYGISGMLFGFGIASICTAAVKAFPALIICRFFVGVFEAGFVASAVVYFSTFYTRKQIAFRIGIFYASSITASAFGGLLAYGVFHIPDGHNLFTWSYLFLFEGSLTLITAIVAAFVLPKDIETAYFLSEEEKRAGAILQLMDSVEQTHSGFNWGDALSEFRTLQFPVRAAIGFSFGVLLNSNANFLAIMTQRLGYSVVKTNLFTVAPAATSACTLLMISFSSDHFQERGLHMVGALSISLVGYLLLMFVDTTMQKGVAYFAIFLCTIGAYPISVIFSAWMVSNINNLNARAATMGVLLALANSSGLLASNIFYMTEAPRYITALRCNCICAGICMLLSGSYSLWMRAENRKRDISFRMQEADNDVRLNNLHAVTGQSGSLDLNFRFRP